MQSRTEATHLLRSGAQNARVAFARSLRIPRFARMPLNPPQKKGPPRTGPPSDSSLPEMRPGYQTGGADRVRGLLGHVPHLLPQPPVQEPQRVAVHFVHRLRGQKTRGALRLRAGREGVHAAGIRDDGGQIQGRLFQYGRPSGVARARRKGVLEDSDFDEGRRDRRIRCRSPFDGPWVRVSDQVVVELVRWRSRIRRLRMEFEQFARSREFRVAFHQRRYLRHDRALDVCRNVFFVFLLAQRRPLELFY